MANIEGVKGKMTAYCLVRDKDGNIKIDDWDALSPEMKQIIEKERANGRSTHAAG